MFHTIVRNVLVLFIFSIGEFTIASAAENRVALVIGNSAYQHAPVLNNPRNDASDIAAAAEKLGFKVITGLDLDKSGMDRTIRRFSEELKGGTIGVFFYAGHGLQVSGRNYLVPVDAQLKTTDALDFEMVGLDVVQRVMEAASETNVLFVDACRDNPLSRNLARAMGTRSVAIGNGLVAQEAGAGTLISFSTQPGNTALDGAGRNSPYAGALAKHITTQGMDLSALLILVRRDVLAATAKRQVPWEHSALTAQLMLALEAPGQTAAVAAPPQAPAEPPAAPAKPKQETRSEAKTQPDAGKTAEVAPQTSRQSVIKVLKPGVMTMARSLHQQNLYDETGTNRLMLGLRDKKELPEGKYFLQDNSTHHMSTALFEIKSGQTVDINRLSGFLSVKGVRHTQQIYDETGTRRLSTYPFDDGIHLPPGRYNLQDHATSHMSATSFEIRVGETVDLSKVSGLLTVKGVGHTQQIYDESGTRRLSTYPFDDEIRLPPGRYNLQDHATSHMSARSFQITAGETLDINQVSGVLTLKGTKKRQHIFDETGANKLTVYPFDDAVHLPPGRYRLIDYDSNMTTAERVDIKAGEEVVIDFGG